MWRYLTGIFLGLTLCAGLAVGNSRADACRLNASNIAGGFGHGAACLINEQGELQVFEYGTYDAKDINKDGSNALIREFRGMPVKVQLDENGNLSKAAMINIIAVFADYYGINEVDVSHFPEAKNYNAAIARVQEIDGNIGKGQKYRLFYRNCDVIASQILQSAGANHIVYGLRPNKISLHERKGKLPKRHARGPWSGKWVRNDNGNWEFFAGK